MFDEKQRLLAARNLKVSKFQSPPNLLVTVR